MRHVGDDLRIANADLLGVVATNQFLEKLPQWMRFRNHVLGPLKSVLHTGFQRCWVTSYPSSLDKSK